MKKEVVTIIFLLFFQSLLWSNPIDGRPNTILSELVFDDKDNWTIELIMSSYRETPYTIDSIVIKVSNISAKIKTSFYGEIPLAVISSDSLSVPITINRNGDKINFYTYSTSNFGDSNYSKGIRTDSLIFGGYPGAIVGQPVNGYSIYRIENAIPVNYGLIYCLTKSSSLGVLNGAMQASAEMKGNIFDTNNELIKGTKVSTYYELDTRLDISADGRYSTRIFRKFDSDSITYLSVRIEFMNSWGDIEKIEPFVLRDITPGTVITQDIHLKSDRYVVTSVEDAKPLLPDDKVVVKNYPNPFNSSTNFYVNIPEGLKEKPAGITIYNVNGQLIRFIPVKKGVTSSWDGRNMNGSIMSSGIYYYRLNIDEKIVKSGSMILLK